MIQPSLDHAGERGIGGDQIGKLVQTQDDAPLLEAQQLQEFVPVFRHDACLEHPAQVAHHLLDLDAAGRFDGLAVKSALGPQPMGQQPGLSHTAASKNDQEPARPGRGLQVFEFFGAIRERQIHVGNHPANNDARNQHYDG